MHRVLLFLACLTALGVVWETLDSAPALVEGTPEPSSRAAARTGAPFLRALTAPARPRPPPGEAPTATTHRSLFGGPDSIWDPGPRLSGQVTDDRCEGVGYLDVTAYDAETGTREGRTRTDYEGRWSLRVPAGSVRLDVTGSTGHLASRTFTVRGDDDVGWDLNLGATRWLRGTFRHPERTPPTTYELRIYGPGGRGTLDAEVEPLANHWSSVQDPQFRFLLRDETTPYWLVVTGPDASLPCHVAGPYRGPQRHYALTVPEARLWEGQVTGRLVPARGGESLTAIVIDAHGFHTYAHLDSRTGEFEITNVPAGSYRFRLEDCLDMVLLERTVTLKHGQPLALGDLYLPRK